MFSSIQNPDILCAPGTRFRRITFCTLPFSFPHLPRSFLFLCSRDRPAYLFSSPSVSIFVFVQSHVRQITTPRSSSNVHAVRRSYSLFFTLFISQNNDKGLRPSITLQIQSESNGKSLREGGLAFFPFFSLFSLDTDFVYLRHFRRVYLHII